MPKIEFNLKNVKEELNVMNNAINEYKDDIDVLFVNLKKVDTAWNDNNSTAFLKNITSDKNEFLDHINSTKRYITIISSFIDSLEDIFYRNLVQYKVTKIKVNTSSINSVINSINNICDYLENSINIIDYMTIPDSFRYKKNINQMRNEIYSIKNYYNQMIKKLDKINSSINDLYNTTTKNLSKVEFKTIDKKKLEYVWKKYGFNGQKINFDSKFKQVGVNNLSKSKYNFSNIKGFNLKKVNINNCTAKFNYMNVESGDINNVSYSNVKKGFINNDLELNTVNSYNNLNYGHLKSKNNDIVLNNVGYYDNLNNNMLKSQDNDIYVNSKEAINSQYIKSNFNINDIEKNNINSAINGTNQSVDKIYDNIYLESDDKNFGVDEQLDMNLSGIKLNSSDSITSIENSTSSNFKISNIGNKKVDNILKAESNIGKFN